MTDISMVRTISMSACSGLSALFKTSHFAMLYVIVAGVTGAILQTGSGGGGVGFVAALALLGAGCLLSASLYQTLFDSEIALGKTASRLSLANALVYMLFGLLGLIAALAFFLLTLVLAVGSGYDLEAEASGELGNVVTAFTDSGAIWLWYIMVAAIVGVLAWFAIRLLLFGAATSQLGAIRIFQTWGWTKGQTRFLAIPTLILVVLPFFTAFALQFAVANVLGEPTLLQPLIGGEAPAGTQASFGVIALFWGISAALAAVPIALGHGLAVTVFKAIGPKPHL